MLRNRITFMTQRNFDFEPWKSDFPFWNTGDARHSQTKSDDSKEFRIVGGTYATQREFPFMVSLQTPLGDHSCGGVILTASEILTAAHCCLPNTLPTGEPIPEDKIVYAAAGHVDLNKMSQTRVIQRKIFNRQIHLLIRGSLCIMSR